MLAHYSLSSKYRRVFFRIYLLFLAFIMLIDSYQHILRTQEGKGVRGGWVRFGGSLTLNSPSLESSASPRPPSFPTFLYPSEVVYPLICKYIISHQ